MKTENCLIVLICALFVILCASCDASDEEVEDEGDDDRPGGYDDPDGYGDDDGADMSYLTVCQVDIVFDFVNQNITFNSHNDALTFVIVYYTDSGWNREGIMAFNVILWNGSDNERAIFDHGDYVEVDVYTGAIDLLLELIERLVNEGEWPDAEDLLCERVFSEL